MFEHLDHREKNGYERTRRRTDVRKRDGSAASSTSRTATITRSSATRRSKAIARQILDQSRSERQNVEYLYELAARCANLTLDDPHVFELEAHVKSLETDGHSPAA